MHKAMPEQGRDRDQILQELEAFKERDPQYKDGRVWSLVYYLDEEHSEFLKDTYHRFACENGLNPGAFKSLKAKGLGFRNSVEARARCSLHILCLFVEDADQGCFRVEE